jgi:hypothetical protein
MLAGLLRFAASKSVKLAAALRGVAGFTGGGTVRYAQWLDGRRKIDVDLSGVAGLKTEIVVKSAPVGALSCRNGAVSGRLDTARGAPIPALAAGDLVEIRQNGDAILRATLIPG